MKTKLIKFIENLYVLTDKEREALSAYVVPKMLRCYDVEGMSEYEIIDIVDTLLNEWENNLGSRIVWNY
jgi:hypothetical protein